MKLSSIKNWKKLGKQDPYYGVLSEEKFRTKNITEEDMKEFFSSGELYVKETENRIKGLFDQSLADCTILDFGCGVGRLVIPFAKLSSKNVVGLDVSSDIIEKAKAHKSALNIHNLEVRSFDGINLPDLPKFDFINSYIVFQHIETSLGFPLLHQLFQKLKKGGVLQVQITYGHALPKATYWNFFLRGKFSLYNFLYSSLKNRRFGSEAVMQMNHYSPQKLFNLFSRYSKSVQVEFTDHGGHLGAYYIMRKDV
ncbi:MAG: class I SAM-dependent methyltransferase [Anditalea sp.]